MEQKDNIMDRISQDKIIKKMNEVIEFTDTLKNKLEEVDGKFGDVSKKIEEVERIATLGAQIKKADAPVEEVKTHEEQVVEAKQEAEAKPAEPAPTPTPVDDPAGTKAEEVKTE